MTISKQMFLHGFIHKVSDAGTFVTCEEEEGEPLNIDLIADNPCIKCYCRVCKENKNYLTHIHRN